VEVSGKLHALASLPPGKEPPVLNEAQSQSGRGGEEKNIPARARNRIPVVLNQETYL